VTTSEFEFGIERFAEDGVLRDARSHIYRFPIVSNAYPRWCYVTAVTVGDIWHGEVPTDDELRIVASFHAEYVERWYRESYKAEMRRKYPFDVDGGANGRILIKYEHGGWGFRRSSWTQGPMFVPTFMDEPMTLVQVLDREQSFGSKPSESWEKWKAEHPDVFGTR
jgi:hypothetical protein